MIIGKLSRDGILPELPSYRLPGRFSVRPALRTQGEKGNAAVLKFLLKRFVFCLRVKPPLHRDSGWTLKCTFHLLVWKYT